MSFAAPSSRPQFDPTVVHPPLAQLRGFVIAQDWAGVADVFAQLQDEDQKASAAGVVGRTAGSEHFLRQTADRLPSETLPRVLLADRLIAQGAEIRTAARAKDVSREQFDAFHDHLRRAEALLIDVCAMEPGNALAWLLRITTALGLQLGRSETRRRYDRLAEHHPDHWAAEGALLQQLCPKWGGSWEAAFAFARECAAAAPPGSPCHTLIAQVHLERWLDLGGREGAAYLSSPGVRAELQAAAASSVFHPRFRAGFHWVSAHGYFAAVHSLAGNHADAAPHFRALGDRATEHPWDYLGDPEAEFVRHRKTALAQGREG
ncbi:hypothetical protein GCM10020367_38680 [Streptomyces sannanensis]|uniref:DUF4034 domain-containing protein n=1 Tax=Streptomyces sannanensis TaxID=285536 RepID=A0ABP6SE07_9ACTN